MPEELVPQMEVDESELEVDLKDLEYKVKIDGHSFGFKVLRKSGETM